MIRYGLDNLGWFQFECLIQSLLKSIIGIGVESWGVRGDWGRDAFYKGNLSRPFGPEMHEGPFVFQVKFVEEANAAGAKPDKPLLKAIVAEIKRMRSRKRHMSALAYAVITNVTLSGDLREKIEELFVKDFPTLKVFTLGGQDVCDILDTQPNLRSAFPQILGLADLETILTSVVAKPIIERSKGMIEEAKDLAPVFYPTNTYSEAWSRLREHFFVVLEGPPEVGKTAIARMIALARLSQGWEALECLRPDDFFQLLSQDKPQIFIADDAFGSTEYDPARTQEWAYNLDRILRRIDKAHWVIWTARKHILEIALERMRLQAKSEAFPAPGAVIVDVGNLSQTEKAMILYRHAKAAGLTENARMLIRSHAAALSYHQHFTPERIRRFVQLSLPILTEKLTGGELNKETVMSAIHREIKEPTKSLKQAYTCLSHDHKRMLVSMLDVDSPWLFDGDGEYAEAYERHRPSGSTTPYMKIEGDLSLSFLKRSRWSIDWVHPSIRDLVIEHLVNSGAERHNFLSVCSVAGIKLALSSAGGAEGDRVYPLIVDSTDMGIAKSRIQKLLCELPEENIVELLSTIYEANLERQDQEEDIESGTREFVSELLECSLDTIIGRWSTSSCRIGRELIALYYKMALLSKLYRPTPPLQVTWTELKDQFTYAVINADQYCIESQVKHFEEILDFVDILKQEDPRYLKHIDFPNSISEAISTFVERCRCDAENIKCFEDDESNLYELLMGESHRHKDNAKVIERLESFGGDINLDNLQASRKIIEKSSYRYERDAEDYYTPEPDEKSSNVGENEISIERLFCDL